MNIIYQFVVIYGVCTLNEKEKQAVEHILSNYKRVLKENEELKNKIMEKDLEIIGKEEYTKASMKEIIEHVGRTCEDSPGPGGSSDIGNVNLKIPVFHPLLDITGKDKTCVVHDRRFERILHTTEMQKALYDGGKILYELGYLLAINEEKLKIIKEMHKKYRKLD